MKSERKVNKCRYLWAGVIYISHCLIFIGKRSYFLSLLFINKLLANKLILARAGRFISRPMPPDVSPFDAACGWSPVEKFAGAGPGRGDRGWRQELESTLLPADTNARCASGRPAVDTMLGFPAGPTPARRRRPPPGWDRRGASAPIAQTPAAAGCSCPARQPPRRAPGWINEPPRGRPAPDALAAPAIMPA